MEHRRIYEVRDEIFENMRNYVKDKVPYSVYISQHKIDQSMPTITFEMPRNELQSKSTNYTNTTRALNFNINVYCYGKHNSKDIVEELALLVCDVMDGFYHFKGGIIAVLPVLANQQPSYQANLRFTASYIPSQMKIY